MLCNTAPPRIPANVWGITAPCLGLAWNSTAKEAQESRSGWKKINFWRLAEPLMRGIVYQGLLSLERRPSWYLLEVQFPTEAWKDAGSLQDLKSKGSQSLISPSGFRPVAITRKYQVQKHPYCTREKISIIKGKLCLLFTDRVGNVQPENFKSSIFSNLGFFWSTLR